MGTPERWRLPFASSAAAARRMSGQRRRNTDPELTLRRALHRRGLRYLVHRRPLPQLRREADVVFLRAKVAVFVDGCFWHGCPDHGRRVHTTNNWYWPEKIARNQERDADTDQRLRAAGWAVIRCWEHENADDIAEHVQETVSARRRVAAS